MPTGPSHASAEDKRCHRCWLSQLFTALLEMIRRHMENLPMMTLTDRRQHSNQRPPKAEEGPVSSHLPGSF